MLKTSASCQSLRLRRKISNSLYFNNEDHNCYQLNCDYDCNGKTSPSVCLSGNLPQWTAEEQHDRHFWYDTSTSGEYCYVGGLECTKVGPRKKCASCRIVCHNVCIPRLNSKCRPTFRKVATSTYRDRNYGQMIVKHHWVLRRQQENRCYACKKWIQTKFKFREALYLQCSWCRLCYHDKPGCFKPALLSVHCFLGEHAKLIIPPTWIVKIPIQDTSGLPFRRCPSNPAFSLAPERLKPSASVGALGEHHRSLNSTDDLVVASCASATGLHLNTSALPSPRPVSSTTSDFPFVVKPSFRSVTCPLIVFINSKAGGNQGVRLMKKFQGLLNPRQVFSLNEGGPKLGLELFGRLPNVRILVCGGDGTVGWILSEIDLFGLYPAPPVAILPLGTGNDLARTLHWGPGYEDEPLSKILTSVEEGRCVLLDRWNVQSRLLTSTEVDLDEDTEISSSSGCEGEGRSTDANPSGRWDDEGEALQVSEKLPLNVMNNYFSLGADAATALEFHESREANPDRFNSRLKNKIFYAGVGGMDLIRRSWRDLSDYITLVCDGINMNSRLKELRPHVLLFLNIPKYSAGTMPWGHSSNSDQQQRIDDKKFEVIGLTTASLATLQMGGHGDRICQCSEVHLVTRRTIPMQIDGEPFRLRPSVIRIQLQNQASMVQKARRYSSSSPAHFGATNTSGRLVKVYIISPDHNETLQSFDHLCKTAQHFTSVRIGVYSDLSTVRRQIKNTHNSHNSNSEAVFIPNKWIFLDMTAINGQVHGIDSSMESAYFITDILSNDNELFLISQDGTEELPCNVLPAIGSGVSRKSSVSSQSSWENFRTLDGYHARRPSLYKSRSAEFLRNDVYRKFSFITCLRTSYSCPKLENTNLDDQDKVHWWSRRNEAEDIENEARINTTTKQKCCLSVWQRWLRISTTTCKRIKRASVGVAPNPVQSLTNLPSTADAASPARRAAVAKISVTSDPGFAMSLHKQIKNDFRAYYFSVCRSGHVQDLRTALDAGVSPMTVEPITGKSGLHYAAKFGRRDIVRCLIENASKELLDLQDLAKKQTALHKAAIGKRRRICEILVQAGACAAIEDINGDTPSSLALAASDKKLAHFLQREELMQLIKWSNEDLPPFSAKLTSLSDLIATLPPLP